MDDKSDKTNVTRREFLCKSALGAAALGVAALSVGACASTPESTTPGDDAGSDVGNDAGRGSDDVGQTADIGTDTLIPTPQCEEESEPNIEGPFYKSGAPERASLLEAGMAGTVLRVSGRVLNTSCEELAGAELDFWQADDNGDYDTAGWQLRGRLHTDAQGRFEVETIVPGHYAGRPAHLHVKVSAPEHTLLTTQLYFEGDPFNPTDPFIRDSLVMTIDELADGSKQASFDFVLARA